MNELVIRPYEGVGPIDFDMTTDQVAAVLGRPQTEMKRGSDWDLQWYYDDLPICVTFDAERRCNFVDFYRGCVGVVEGVRLAGSYRVIVDQLRRRGYEYHEPTVHTLFMGEVSSGDTLWDALG